jgi:hypothetical protein
MSGQGAPLPVLTGRGRGWGSPMGRSDTLKFRGTRAGPTPYPLPAKKRGGET